MSVEMSERQRNCRVCDSWGCSRCADEPGEQGLTGDEKELLRLRDRVRELEAGLRDADDAARTFLNHVLDTKYFGLVERGDARPLREISQMARRLLEGGT